MQKKNLIRGFSLIAVFILVFSMNLFLISAITAAIGNGRMIINAEVGDTIERSILVKNVNDISVYVNLTASGDLADSIDIIDDNFILEPGTEKKAYFNVEVTDGGTTTSQINVQFTPDPASGEKNGVGLISTIIINTGGSDTGDDSDPDTGDITNSTDDSDTNPVTGNVIGNSKIVMIGGISFVVLLVLLILLMVLSKLRNSNDMNQNNIRQEIKQEVTKEEVETKPKRSVKRREK